MISQIRPMVRPTENAAAPKAEFSQK